MLERFFLSVERSSDRLFHTGTEQRFDFDPFGSGHYRQGSGKNPHQRNRSFAKFYEDNIEKYGAKAIKEAWGYDPDHDIPDAEMNFLFRSMVEKYRKMNGPDGKRLYSDTEIARKMGVSSTEFRKIITISSSAERASNIAKAKELEAKGMTPAEIAKEMNESGSTVRSWLLADENKASSTQVIADYLKDQVKEKKYLDIGAGVEAQIGVSHEKLAAAVKILQDEGFKVQDISVPQATDPRKKTNMQILVPDGVTRKDVWDNREQIRSPKGSWYDDDSLSMRDVKDPVSIDPKRIEVKYADDGGLDNDGLIELRPGVDDISLGSNHYAQVRIAVDGTHYMKGMAIYADDLPPGKDIRVYSNKSEGTPLLGTDNEHSVLKNMKKNKKTGEIDEENPFGSTIRQFDYYDADGNKHQSAINLVNTEEDWAKWSTRWSKQTLSYQPLNTIKNQLNLLYLQHKDEFEEARKYPNNTIKKELLQNIADECDHDAVHLYGAAMANQSVRLILPCNSLKDNECYAPGYENGEKIIAIRYPNAGPFECPVLTVNNNIPEGKSRYGTAERVLGVTAKTRAQMSGADSDGDTAQCAPIGNYNLNYKPAINELLNFEPKREYAWHEGMVEPKYIGKPKKEGGDGLRTGYEMGLTANLLMDMNLKAAPLDNIIRAAKHSMVVIDAEKHKLDWKQSEKDNDIKALKMEFEGNPRGGGSTLITRNKKTIDVKERAPGAEIDPDTGRLIYRDAKGYYDRNTGEVKYRTEKAYLMTETRDAYNLVSRDENGKTTAVETVYADHANRLMKLADEIRKEVAATPDTPMNRTARAQYRDEYESLNNKLRVAEMNAPYERLAQAAASKKIQAIIEANPGIKGTKEESKVRTQVINATRKKAGASKREDRVIHPTDREWEALVAGVLSKERTREVISNMKTDEVMERTFPKQTRPINSAKLARAKALYKDGNGSMSLADVAKELGVNESTLRSAMARNAMAS